MDVAGKRDPLKKWDAYEAARQAETDAHLARQQAEFERQWGRDED